MSYYQNSHYPHVVRMETPLTKVATTASTDVVLRQRMLLILGMVMLVVFPALLSLLPQTSDAQLASNSSDRQSQGAMQESQKGGVRAKVAHGSGELSPVFTPEVKHWQPQIATWADTFGLDPNLVAIIMQIESCGDPQALSGAGAQGLFQVMPFHFAPGEDAFAPETNALRGLAYFAERLDQTQGDVGRAFAGYNGGQLAAASSWSDWHPETQRYYVWSTGIYRDVQAGLEKSPTLEEWLRAGGSSLCRQAASRLGL